MVSGRGVTDVTHSAVPRFAVMEAEGSAPHQINIIISKSGRQRY